MLPGEVAAKHSGKPPISKPLPKWYFKKKVPLQCNILIHGAVRKVRIQNSLGYTLMTGNRIFWRAKGSRGDAGGVILLYQPFQVGKLIHRNVPPTISDCSAWTIVPINHY